jgi:ubiquinone/menaquinone biosynthesis C-methylase UbiE
MYPKNFARFYDTIYHSMRDGVDNEFFQKKIRQAEGKVLEIGVGTGRMFTEALSGGADIYGLDISEAMLRVLYGKIPHDQHFRIGRQSIVDFSLDHSFDLIIAPFRVFMHLQDKTEQIAALNNVYRHLKSGGHFIFDVFVPDLNQIITGLKYQKDFDDEYSPGYRVRRFVSTTPDLMNQTITVSFHLEWEEKSGMQSDDWTIPLRFFFRFELEHLIERSDFKTCKIYGDYNGGELNKDSREFIISCRKS